jgi:hypothetical protein
MPVVTAAPTAGPSATSAAVVAAHEVCAVTVPFHLDAASFAAGDDVRVTRVTGDRPKIEVGGTYCIEGTYVLGSAGAASLMLWSTNGELDTTHRADNRRYVSKGSGTFSFVAKPLRDGKLHVSYYPAPPGGSAFGGVYLVGD